MKAECELDSLASGARWGDDDHSASRWLRRDECCVVGRKVFVLDGARHVCKLHKKSPGWNCTARGTERKPLMLTFPLLFLAFRSLDFYCVVVYAMRLGSLHVVVVMNS